MKRKTIVLIVIAGLLFCSAVFAVFVVSSHAVAGSGFAQISKGMTAAQVRQLLGTPHHVRRDAPDRTAFYYGGLQRSKWCTMEVFFGADGRVTGKFHDH